VHALETYLQRATNATEDDKSQLQRRIDNLNALIAQQTPAVAPTAVVPVPAPIAPTPSPTPQPIPPPPPSVDDRHHTAAPWILVGSGGATAIAGAVMIPIGINDVNSASSACGKSTTKCNAGSAAATNSAVSQGETGGTLKIAGQALLWSGLGVAAAGILWHILEPTGPVSKDSTKASVVPAVGPGYAGANVLGRF
jgi:hypothetical protein